MSTDDTGWRGDRDFHRAGAPRPVAHLTPLQKARNGLLDDCRCGYITAKELAEALKELQKEGVTSYDLSNQP